MQTDHNSLSRAFRNAFIPFAVGVLVISAAILWIGFSLSRKYELLAEHGIMTQGVITQKEQRRGSKGGKNYVAIYEFQVQNKSLHSDILFLSREEWLRTSPGQKIEVTYLEEDPSIYVPFSMKSDLIDQPLIQAVKFVSALLLLTLVFPLLVYFTVSHFQRSDRYGSSRDKE